MKNDKLFFFLITLIALGCIICIGLIGGISLAEAGESADESTEIKCLGGTCQKISFTENEAFVMKVQKPSKTPTVKTAPEAKPDGSLANPFIASDYLIWGAWSLVINGEQCVRVRLIRTGKIVYVKGRGKYTSYFAFKNHSEMDVYDIEVQTLDTLQTATNKQLFIQSFETGSGIPADIVCGKPATDEKMTRR